MIKDSSIFKHGGTRGSLDNRDVFQDHQRRNGSKLGPVSEESRDYDDVADRIVREMPNSEKKSTLGESFIETDFRRKSSGNEQESILWSSKEDQMSYCSNYQYEADMRPFIQKISL